MADHRIRLSPEDVELIVSALRARAAMTTKLRRHRVERLIQRLESPERGNPRWRLEDLKQTHESKLDVTELE